MGIDDALRQERLDARLIPKDVETNPWFLIMERDLSYLCEKSLSVPLRFTFNVSHKIQAGVIYRSKLVVMTAGMFNVLCRLACKVVSSGAFISFEGGVEPEWKPDIEASYRPVISDLSAGFFDWKSESEQWMHAADRQLLFFYILQSLARFVVLHEVGHVANNHGARFQEGGSSFIDIDLAQPDLLTVEEGVASQARELLADGFAFIRLKQVLDKELAFKAGTEAAKVLVSKLLQGDRERIRFLLSIVYLYFHMMDRNDWYSENIFRLTHPPAPFRLKNLFALTLENGISNLSEDEVGLLLKEQCFACSALVSVVYNQYPRLNWFEEVGSPRFNELFAALYEEFPKWCG